jgi:hypothetical protein
MICGMTGWADEGYAYAHAHGAEPGSLQASTTPHEARDFHAVRLQKTFPAFE